MIPGRIEGASLTLGKPKDWQESSGRCCGLPVRVIDCDTLHAFQSAWLPTPEELRDLNAGAAVHITIVGRAHPPIALSVGPVPE